MQPYKNLRKYISTKNTLFNIQIFIALFFLISFPWNYLFNSKGNYIKLIGVVIPYSMLKFPLNYVISVFT